MGYRSDVYMCIAGPQDTILAGIATLRLQGDQHMHEALDEWKVVENAAGQAVMVLGGQGTDWKWYDSCPDVQAHNSVFHHFEALGDEDAAVHGVFVRIGEDDTDIEARSFNEGYEMGSIERGIFRAYDGRGPDLRPRLANSSQV